MHVNILILIVYTSNYQSDSVLYENMRSDFVFFRIEDGDCHVIMIFYFMIFTSRQQHL